MLVNQLKAQVAINSTCIAPKKQKQPPPSLKLNILYQHFFPSAFSFFSKVLLISHMVPWWVGDCLWIREWRIKVERHLSFCLPKANMSDNNLLENGLKTILFRKKSESRLGIDKEILVPLWVGIIIIHDN